MSDFDRALLGSSIARRVSMIIYPNLLGLSISIVYPRAIGDSYESYCALSPRDRRGLPDHRRTVLSVSPF